jgi:branched-chain amino acid aminotransferase
VQPDEPAISALDHGVTVGDGVFETLKVVNRQPFAMTRHLDRLERSAAGLGLPAPDRDDVRDACADVVAQLADDTVHRLRITFTAGQGPLGSERSAGASTLIVAASPAPAWDGGTTLATAPWPRNERSPLTGLKTTSYADNVVALSWAKQRGAGEAVFANSSGRLCEGTGSNVFVVMDGRLLTPSLSSGCLAGITRALVIEWCGAIEDDLPVDALRDADEVFITSSTRDVQAVTAVDGKSKQPGATTAQAARVFAERSAAQIDP